MPQDFSYNTCPIKVLLKVVEWVASCEVTVYVSFPHNVIDKIVAGHSMWRGKVCLSRKLPPTIFAPLMVLPLLHKLSWNTILYPFTSSGSAKSSGRIPFYRWDCKCTRCFHVLILFGSRTSHNFHWHYFYHIPIITKKISWNFEIHCVYKLKFAFWQINFHDFHPLLPRELEALYLWSVWKQLI